MFEKLVVSTMQRRRGRTSRFFLGTVFVYTSVVASAFALSVVLSTPQLADSDLRMITRIQPVIPVPAAPQEVRDIANCGGAPPPADLRNVRGFDDIVAQPQAVVSDPFRPPTVSFDSDAPIGGGDSNESPLIGVPGGDLRSNDAPPRPPDPPKPVAAKPSVEDTRPLRLTSVVLQGKALEKRTPMYPPLAKQIHLQGDVSVEVMIAPDGRVESARIVSGHPMFSQAARDAALAWRFSPTLLNGVAVRVTGVIVFVFKIND